LQPSTREIPEDPIMQTISAPQLRAFGVILVAAGIAAALLLGPQAIPSDRTALPAKSIQGPSDPGNPSPVSPENPTTAGGLPRVEQDTTGSQREKLPDPANPIPTTLDNASVIDFAELRRKGIGDIPDDIEAFLCEAFSNFESTADARRQECLARGPDAVLSVEFATIELDLFGASAKTDALLSGDYVLVPLGQESPANDRHDRYHVLLAPGGQKDGVPYKTYIYVDLIKFPKFAQALKNYSAARERKDAREQQERTDNRNR
jgi:hypothetical protein